MENTNKACNDRMNMLDGDDLGSPPKKLKASRNYGSVNESGGFEQNNCTVINIISFYNRDPTYVSSTEKKTRNMFPRNSRLVSRFLQLTSKPCPDEHDKYIIIFIVANV